MGNSDCLFFVFSAFPAFAAVAFDALVVFGASTFASASLVAFAAFSMLDSFVSCASIPKCWESQNPKHSHQISQPKNHLFFHSVVCMWFSLPWFSMCSQFTSAADFFPSRSEILPRKAAPFVTLKLKGRFSCRPQTHPKKKKQSRSPKRV